MAHSIKERESLRVRRQAYLFSELVNHL
uniref:Uncharacterized protein n=1 Tax=Moniliophthora roreri TaxID=221103 RepID=A0A0W0GFL4_MONRR